MLSRKLLLPSVMGVVLALALIGAQTWQSHQQRMEIARLLTGGDSQRAPPLLRRFGCTGCHAIPGVEGAEGKVGPELADMRARVFIAGRLPNNGENLVHWIMRPQSFADTAMPDTGISEIEARDAAAYLYAH